MKGRARQSKDRKGRCPNPPADVSKDKAVITLGRRQVFINFHKNVYHSRKLTQVLKSRLVALHWVKPVSGCPYTEAEQHFQLNYLCQDLSERSPMTLDVVEIKM